MTRFDELLQEGAYGYCPECEAEMYRGADNWLVCPLCDHEEPFAGWPEWPDADDGDDIAA